MDLSQVSGDNFYFVIGGIAFCIAAAAGGLQTRFHPPAILFGSIAICASLFFGLETLRTPGLMPNNFESEPLVMLGMLIVLACLGFYYVAEGTMRMVEDEQQHASR